MTHKFKDPMQPKHHTESRPRPRQERSTTGELVDGLVSLALVGAVVNAVKK